jgi:hypothetical protein
MIDSENAIENQTPIKTEKNEEIVMRKGEPVKLLRGGGGRFQKSPKTMPKTIDVTRLMRNLLNQPIANEDGKLTKGGISRFRKLFDNIYNIATMSPEQPVMDRLGNVLYVVGDDGNKHPLMVKDAKIAMASVQAFKELMLRAYGMPSKSDEEMEAMKTQGVKIVILQHPEMMDKTVVEDKPRPKLEPAFAEVLEITENK